MLRSCSRTLRESLSFTRYIVLPVPDPPDTRSFRLPEPGIAGETTGTGPDIVLAHGLTATRRYVVSGSNALPRAGYRLTTYDARGHGTSDPASSYEYADLVEDLAAVIDHLGAERAVVGGASMGAATAVAFALAYPERVRALILITPAYEGQPSGDYEQWDRLADGLEHGGVDGFLAAYDPPIGEPWRGTVLKVARQRLGRHEHPEAVADALRAVPRSVAFGGLEELERIAVPALVVASHDEADPGHPLRVGEAYAARLPDAELAMEQPGKSPLAWQGARLSRRIEDFLTRV
jgi:pimeloyl-ACP methyl ester carboxylesterase